MYWDKRKRIIKITDDIFDLVRKCGNLEDLLKLRKLVNDRIRRLKRKNCTAIEFDGDITSAPGEGEN